MEAPLGHSDARAKWGDRAGRRRDILRAASDVLETRGFDHFNVRSIAKGAGVSSATLYDYFPTKNDIFAALMIRRFGDLQTLLAQLEPGSTRSIEHLVVRIMPELTDMYRHFGRHIHHWMREEADDSPVVRSLKTAFAETTLALERALREAAARESITLDESPLLMPFVWASLYGIADHNLTNMHEILGYTRDGLTRYGARALAHGLARRASD